MDSQKIKENVEIGKSVKEVICLAMAEASNFRDKNRFWSVLVDQIHAIVGPAALGMPKPIEQVPMSDEEARAFGRSRISFGTYINRRIDEIPISWLEWYADQPLQGQIRRYLHSKRIQQERETDVEVEASETC